METIDNMKDAQSSETNSNKTGIDQEILDNLYHSFYTQNIETLENVFRQVGEPLMEEMASQIPDFDPDGEHKELFEQAVYKNIPATAEPYIMGVINGGLVAFLEIGRRLNLDITNISKTLNNLNPNKNAKANLTTYMESKNVSDEKPIHEEETGTKGSGG